MTANGVEIKGVKSLSITMGTGEESKVTLNFANFEIDSDFLDGNIETYHADERFQSKPEPKNECLRLRQGGDHLHQGDYLLGTKWSDGSGKDAWSIGFLSSVHNTNKAKPNKSTRYYLVDGAGESLRLNGFWRVEKITQAEGDHLLGHKLAIENRGMNLYECLRNYRKGLTYDGRSRADQS